LVLHLSSYAKVDKYGFILTPFQIIEHNVANDGKSLVNRIALSDIVGDDGKVIVKDKEHITEKNAKDIKSKIKAKEVEVR
jgi:hypothetical protein